MKTTRFLRFLLIMPLIVTVLSGCGDDESKDEAGIVMMSVSSEITVMNALGADALCPVECMLVRIEGEDGQWRPLPMGSIEHFNYERGHEYELRVKRTILANPPMDGSDRTYTLLSVVSDRMVTAPEEPVEKVVKSESDIEYAALAPIKKYAVDSVFYVNADGTIENANHETMPSYNNKRIWVTDILDKAGPDWVDLQRVTYMAVYTYVFSPLTTTVRLVRINYGGPLFKDVIPQEEFAHITQSMKSGEELTYTLILANVYKKGLQKQVLTVRKK